MLGLGSGLFRDPGISQQLLGTYTSDFTSGIDGWGQYDAAIIIGGNQSIDGSSGWLKVAFTETQDNESGITKSLGWATTAGDLITYEFKIHIVDGGGDWDPEGDSDAVTTKWNFGQNITANLNLDQTYTRTGDMTVQANSADQTARILWAFADDLPQAGAVFYVKDFVLNWYG